ncbi:hypothetical protein MUBE_06940 [Mycobacterium uberis]|uniref:Uncharacterized protein n=1 Tax=Mycobacterium uberis TaxID=2162698 RepID=A0A3E1HHM1_9MYCO|nr:hypothetical protein MUBE_06940 [Mycobacterium uberis]
MLAKLQCRQNAGTDRSVKTRYLLFSYAADINNVLDVINAADRNIPNIYACWQKTANFRDWAMPGLYTGLA